MTEALSDALTRPMNGVFNEKIGVEVLNLAKAFEDIERSLTEQVKEAAEHEAYVNQQ